MFLFGVLSLIGILTVLHADFGSARPSRPGCPPSVKLLRPFRVKPNCHMWTVGSGLGGLGFWELAWRCSRRARGAVAPPLRPEERATAVRWTSCPFKHPRGVRHPREELPVCLERSA